MVVTYLWKHSPCLYHRHFHSDQKTLGMTNVPLISLMIWMVLQLNRHTMLNGERALMNNIISFGYIELSDCNVVWEQLYFIILSSSHHHITSTHHKSRYGEATGLLHRSMTMAGIVQLEPVQYTMRIHVAEMWVKTSMARVCNIFRTIFWNKITHDLTTTFYNTGPCVLCMQSTLHPLSTNMIQSR